MKKLSLIFSFRNESENIDELITRALNVIDRLKGVTDFELIFVNDSSTDDSKEKLLGWSDRLGVERIRILNTTRRFGPAVCVLEGIRHATGDIIGYLDSDLQDPPELLLEMVPLLSNNFDVIHTKRMSRKGESISRLFWTRVAYKVINMISEVELEPEVGDFKVFNRRVADVINSLPEQNPYLRGLFVWVGFRQYTLPYERLERKAGVSNVSSVFSLATTNSLVNGISNFSLKPLFYLFYVSAGMLLVFLCACICVALMLLLGVNVGLFGFTMVGIFGVAAINVAGLSLLGLYIMKIFENTTGRPRVILSDRDLN